jgi:hypothetical protein
VPTSQKSFAWKSYSPLSSVLLHETFGRVFYVVTIASVSVTMMMLSMMTNRRLNGCVNCLGNRNRQRYRRLLFASSS